jgi:hypothetical protein
MHKTVTLNFSTEHPLVGARVAIDEDQREKGWIVWGCIELDEASRPLLLRFAVVLDDGSFTFREDEHITVLEAPRLGFVTKSSERPFDPKVFRERLVGVRDRRVKEHLGDENAGHPNMGLWLAEIGILNEILAALDAATGCSSSQGDPMTCTHPAIGTRPAVEPAVPR